MSEPTQPEKIIDIMVKNDAKVWWFPPDFMRPGMENFGGYEASARLSELAKLYPHMIESRRVGKYMERRIRWETISDWYTNLPATFRAIFRKHERAPRHTWVFDETKGVMVEHVSAAPMPKLPPGVEDALQFFEDLTADI